MKRVHTNSFALSHFFSICKPIIAFYSDTLIAFQVTRSIGDGDVKRHGVTAAPEISTVRLVPADQFIILATDGFWDVLSPDECVALVCDTVKEPDMCAKRLVTEALARGSNDNVTVVIAFLQPVASLERIFGEGQQAPAAARTFFGSRSAAPDMSSYARGATADELQDTY